MGKMIEPWEQHECEAGSAVGHAGQSRIAVSRIR
jgi:hypothetical protein